MAFKATHNRTKRPTYPNGFTDSEQFFATRWMVLSLAGRGVAKHFGNNSMQIQIVRMTIVI